MKIKCGLTDSPQSVKHFFLRFIEYFMEDATKKHKTQSSTIPVKSKQSKDFT